MSRLPVESLRRAADRWLSRFFANFEGPASEPVNAVLLGRALLAVTGCAVLGFAPLLKPNQHTWTVLAAVSVCMASFLGASLRVDWSRRPAWSTACFPLLVCMALSCLGVAAPGFAAPLTGVLTLCFAYVGLTQPPGTAVLALPIAAATFLCVYGGVTPPVAVRLLIALFVWSVLGELLARLMRRQQSLTTTLSGAAHHDELTGVPNRRDLQLRMTRAAPGDTLVMCDLDHFKQINDTSGHLAGDRVLAEFGALLRVTLRGADYCARYGGEEFVLLLPATTGSQAGSLLDRLKSQWATLQPAITFSAGVATCTRDRSASDTLSVADAMLYEAKSTGRNKVVTESTVAVASTVS